MSEINVISIPFGSISAAATYTPATGTDFFKVENSDSRMTLLVKNTGAQSASVSLNAGNGSLAPLGDVKFTVASGAELFIPLSRVETARVKITSGADKGKVFISTTVDSGGTVGNISFAVISVE